MKKVLTMTFLVFIFIVGCSKTEEQNVENEAVIKPYEEVVILADELKIPWAINKIGDTFYLSERTGQQETHTKQKWLRILPL